MGFLVAVAVDGGGGCVTFFRGAGGGILFNEIFIVSKNDETQTTLYSAVERVSRGGKKPNTKIDDPRNLMIFFYCF